MIAGHTNLKKIKSRTKGAWFLPNFSSTFCCIIEKISRNKLKIVKRVVWRNVYIGQNCGDLLKSVKKLSSKDTVNSKFFLNVFESFLIISAEI